MSPLSRDRIAEECEVLADSILAALIEIDATMGDSRQTDYDRGKILAAIRRTRGLPYLPEPKSELAMQYEQAWIDEVKATLDRLKQAWALEGLGVHEGDARKDVDLALGRLGMLEAQMPRSLMRDAELAVQFARYHEIARERIAARNARHG